MRDQDEPTKVRFWVWTRADKGAALFAVIFWSAGVLIVSPHLFGCEPPLNGLAMVLALAMWLGLFVWYVERTDEWHEALSRNSQVRRSCAIFISVAGILACLVASTIWVLPLTAVICPILEAARAAVRT